MYCPLLLFIWLLIVAIAVGCAIVEKEVSLPTDNSTISVSFNLKQSLNTNQHELDTKTK
jgi:predicted component of type VI protein secretion system